MTCINCSYRLVNLQQEIARFDANLYRGKPEEYYLGSKERGKSSCNKKRCLVDKLELKRLLNSNQLNNSKRGKKTIK